MKAIRASNLRNNIPVDVAEQETQPLNLDTLSSAAAFHAYLAQFDLESLRVAIAAGVRYLTIWNIQQGNPISQEQAVLVRRGLQKLTGVGYTAPIATLEAEKQKAGKRE